MPEEVNRRIVDHTSDVNMPYSDISRECLLREGLSPDLIVKTGSPMQEILAHYEAEIEESDVINELDLDVGNFFVASFHREENVDEEAKFTKLIELVNTTTERHGLPVVLSLHPRTAKRLQASGLDFNRLVRTMKPLGFFDYVKLQKSAKAVLSDSGTISEESSILNFPAINIRESQERHEAVEEGSVIFTGLNLDRVFQALDIISAQGRNENRTLNKVRDYQSDNVSDKVLRTVHSYTDYVNRVVWKKY